MKLKTKLIIVGVAFVCILLFLFREEFSEGISFSEVKPIADKEEVNFFVTSDIHYLYSKINDGGNAFKTYIQNGDSKQSDYINEITDAFIDDVINKKPEFLIISGDLTNNGELKYSAKDKEIEYTTNTVDIEGWANKTGQGDDNLIGFNKYSKEFFDLKTYKMAEKVLEKPNTYSEEEKQNMVKTLINLNERVFEGRDSESDEELLNSEGYKLWLNYDSEFYRNYVRTSTKDNNLEDNSFKINISE